jgi:hypothetical protein
MGNGLHSRTGPPDNCKEVVGLLSEYLNRTLPGDEAVAIKEHLSGCTNCERFFQSLETTVNWTRGLQIDDIPAEVVNRLQNFLKTKVTRND